MLDRNVEPLNYIFLSSQPELGEDLGVFLNFFLFI